MVVGFNHNFSYKGEVYHIQTEDGGLKSPQIVTLLYHGGTILASKKTSYADIAKIDNLEMVVEDLMKEQHRDMLRGLKSGRFDDLIERFLAGRGGPRAESVAPAVASAPVASPTAAQPVTAPPRTAPPPIPARPKPEPQGPAVVKPVSPPGGAPLDDVVLAYLTRQDKNR